jgi:hypothetical protein
MILLLASTITVAQPATATRWLELCRPALARKAGGEIQSITVQSTRIGRRSTIVRGETTVFIGMGTPGPGSASAHHLIRATYHYSCSIRSGRVTRVTLTQP